MKNLILIFIALFFQIISLNCFADDPCEGSKNRVNDLVTALNGFATMNSNFRVEIPIDGTFKISPHKRSEWDIVWVEITYVSNGKIISEAVFQSLSHYNEHFAVSINQNGNIILNFSYGAGGKISCSYILRAESNGFKVAKID